MLRFPSQGHLGQRSDHDSACRHCGTAGGKSSRRSHRGDGHRRLLSHRQESAGVNAKHIRADRGGITPITSFDTGSLKIKHAGEIKDYQPPALFTSEELQLIDLTGQFGVIAASQALADARIQPEEVGSDRIGLVAGVCAGGKGGPVRPSKDIVTDIANDPAWTAQFLGAAHFAQTAAVAWKLGIRGPCATLSTACASSGSALGYAYELLQGGKADVVLAGGTDSFTLSTYAGFYALGAMAPKPCSPFSVSIGVSFGEGAGFVVLEPLARARVRGATIYGELVGFGARGDAHHITAPHPSGEGLARAIRSALTLAGLTPQDINYVNAHGTGTRDNDTSETQAIKQIFKGCPTIPPISSTKSYFGHTLGAAGILEFIVSLLCQKADLIPPTINFESPRPGCDLDYVPNTPRSGKIKYFLSTNAAFGGINTAVVGGALDLERPRPARRLDQVVITGMGLVSPLGCSLDDFVQALSQGQSGVALLERFDTSSCKAHKGAVVKGFEPRKLVPTVELRRLDLLNQFAAVAAGLALKDAGLDRPIIPEDRLGVVQALTRGPVGAQQRFLEALAKDGIEKLSAKYFPAMVVSTVSGQVSQSFNLKGTNSTLVEGLTAGLHALAHAYEMLWQTDDQDALVVVAADEIAPLFFRLFDRLGLLAHPDAPGGEQLAPYDPQASGMILGEGAVALVLERRRHAEKRGARIHVQLAGVGLTADAFPASGGGEADPEDRWLTRAMELALAEAGLGAAEVDVAYGHGRGLPASDAREVRAWQRLLAGRATPLCCVLGHTGVAEASAGLYSVAAALLGMQRGAAWPVLTAGSLPKELAFVQGQVQHGPYRTALVAGSTEQGNNAAVVLRRMS